jgi:hypothetical protein
MIKTNIIKLISVSVIGGLIVLGLLWYFSGSGFFRQVMNPQTITIKNCLPEPAFLLAQQDKPVYFINRDSQKHTIKIAGQEVLLRPREKRILSAEFSYGSGTYSYDCDGSANVGQVQIAPSQENQEQKGQSFREFYDSLTKELQSCLKKSLADKFEKVYNNEAGFVLTAGDQEAINSCFKRQL